LQPTRISLPRKGRRVGLRIDYFRGLLGIHSRYGLHTRAVTIFVTRISRRLQTFRLLHACSGCFRLEQFAGWGLHPLENAAFARRTPSTAVPVLSLNDSKAARKPTIEEDVFGILSSGTLIVPAFFGEAGPLRVAVVRAQSPETWQPFSELLAMMAAC
jgi:hypothetical protein